MKEYRNTALPETLTGNALPRAATDEVVRRIATDPVAALASGEVRVLKEIRYRHRQGDGERPPWKSLVMATTQCEPRLVIKLFYPGNVARRFYYFTLGKDPLANAERMSRKLQDRLKTPKALAYGQMGSPLIPDYSYIAWPFLDNAIHYEDFIETYLASRGHADSSRTAIFHHAVTQLARIHVRGIYLYDLNPSHVFVDATAREVDDTEWILIDLDEVRLRPRLWQYEIVKNLYQVWRYFIAPNRCASLEQLCHEYIRLTGFSRCSPLQLRQRVEIRIARDWPDYEGSKDR